ncbi:MAG: hypothetical protein AB8H80_01180 [Planctomycetota bacterium]
MPRSACFWILTAAAVVAAVWQAWALAWTCDDAFITFRYAQNFVDGHGLVFNLDPQEAPVEGYTNFSWTMWLALGAMFGWSHEGMTTWSVFWGIACHAGTVVLLAAMAWRSSGGRAVMPIAACAYASIHHAASLAPAGLETALFVLLVTAMLKSVIAVRCARDAWLLGFLGVLCAMTRPDGGLFVAVAGLFVLYDAWRRRAPRLLLAYVLPSVLVFAPYLLWRHAYYGSWVPNTAVAKSAGEAYLKIGVPYVTDFFLCYWALLPVVLVLLGFSLRRGDLLATISPYLGRRPWFAIAAFALPYTGFVAWVGGDFMFSRFLLPVLPALLIGWDFACQRWRAAWLQPALAVGLVVGLQLRVEPDGLDDHRKIVSDNRRISMKELAPGLTLVDASRIVGTYLRDLFADLDVRVAITGGHANIAFRAEVPVAVECAAGLTDAHIARLPAPRGKPGHDKPRDPRYLEKRGVHFMFENNYLMPADPWRTVMFKSVGFPVRLVTWDRELMRELKRRDPNIDVRDFEAVLDDYLGKAAGLPRKRVRADYAKFRRFYFEHNEDPEREAAFEALVR